MANLPNRPFLINYNARDYDPSTYTFRKTAGQTFDEDFTMTYRTGYITAHTEDGYVSVAGANGRKALTAETNPFNRAASASTFTAVYKMSSSTYEGNVFANRQSNYNYMIRDNYFHTVRQQLYFIPTQSPAITYVRVDANGNGERKCVTTNQVATETIEWGQPAEGFTLFGGYMDGAELFQGDFYWLYISNESLTDSEIAQVIAYNEGTSPIYADPDSLSFGYEASSSTITLNADTEMSWTATSIPSWITLSSSAGTGTATIAVSAAKNNTISPRTATIVFSNGEDTAEVECTQAKHPLLVPFNNIYRNGLIN